MRLCKNKENRNKNNRKEANKQQIKIHYSKLYQQKNSRLKVSYRHKYKYAENIVNLHYERVRNFLV